MEESENLHSFQCDVCNLFLKSRIILKFHKKTHKKDQNFRCRVCFKSFKQRKYLKDHIKRLHSQSKLFATQVPITPSSSIKVKAKKSPKEGNEYDNRQSGGADMATGGENDDNAQGKSKQFSCCLCHENFDERRLLKLHNVFACDQRQFQCFKCDMRFINQNLLNRHFFYHGSLVYLCHFENCNADFSLIEFLQEHQRIKGHSCGDVMNITPKRICTKENNLAESSISSSNSEASSDDSKSETFDCDLCSKFYWNESSLIRHKKEKHNVETPPKERDRSTPLRLTKEKVEAYFSLSREHACVLCDLRFNNFITLRSHIQKHKDYKFECESCDFKYSRVEILEEHNARVHQSAQPSKKARIENISPNTKKQDVASYFSLDRKFLCILCDLRFNHALTLQDHISKHDEYKFVCQTCNKKYARRKILEYHQMRAHGQQMRSIRFKCDKCNSTFKHREYLKQHAKKVHKILMKVPLDWMNIPKMFSLERPFSCSQCDLRFQSSKGISEHIRKHDGFKYKCEVDRCGYKYWHEDILKEHQKRAHAIAEKSSTSSKSFKCHLCNSCFNLKNNLTTHLRVKHGIVPKRFDNVQIIFSTKRPIPCLKCDVRFKTSKGLSRHMRNHSTFKFKCDVNGCGMSYWHEEILKEHQRRTHKRTDDINECDNNSSNAEPYVEEKVQKKEPKTSFKLRKFKCHKCDASYKQRCNLVTHLRIVHNILPKNVGNLFSPARPYQCTQCDLRFEVKGIRDTHEKNHLTFVIKCDIENCGLMYSKSVIMREHQRIAHNKEFKGTTKIVPKEHQKRVHKDAETPLINQSSKNRHSLESKQEAQRFRCSKCTVSYKSRGNLVVHMKKKHNISLKPGCGLNISNLFASNRPHKCNKCDLKFSFSSVLKTHLKKHPFFKYKCEINDCGMRYWHEEILKEHQRRAHKTSSESPSVTQNHWHNSILKLFSQKRPLSCEKCDLRFNIKQGLQRHTARHPSFKYKCDQCGFE